MDLAGAAASDRSQKVGATVIAAQRGARLIAQVVGNDQVSLSAESARDFFGRAADLMISTGRYMLSGMVTVALLVLTSLLVLRRGRTTFCQD